jgi:alpha-tubulin suppressor-like RCC1 family protein
VSVGAFHACAVTTAGAGYCWGDGGMGDLGDGTVYGGTSFAPVAGGHTFASISAGVYSSCGLTTAGAAYCWGSNMLGGLGTGFTGPEQCQSYEYSYCSTVPVSVTGGFTFRQVEAKVYAACGLTLDGTTYCWGSNLNDNLGYHTHTGPEQCNWDESYIVPCTRLPLAVPGLPALVSFSADDSYGCGLTSAGVAYCWGYPQNVGDLTSNTGPVEVPGDLTFATLSTGPYSTCGVTPAGVAYCWGDNSQGKLGDGTTTSSRVPVKVAGQP